MKGKSGYLKWGLTIFLTVCAILVFYDTFYMSGALQRLLSKLASILSPVLVGLVMAYLLAPIVNWFEKLILSGLHRIKNLEGKTIPHAAGWLRAVSILLTWAIVLLLLYLMFSVVIPQLIDSVVMLINNAETYYNKIYGWITNLLDKNPKVEDWVNENLETYYQNLLDLLTNKVLPGAQQMLTTITGGVISGHLGPGELRHGLPGGHHRVGVYAGHEGAEPGPLLQAAVRRVQGGPRPLDRPGPSAGPTASSAASFAESCWTLSSSAFCASSAAPFWACPMPRW